MLLLKNMLIQWLDGPTPMERIERILWIDPERQYVYLFEVGDPAALPARRTYNEIVAALQRTEARVVQRTNLYLLQSEEQFTAKQRQSRDENWALIAPIVQTAGETAFIPSQRSRLIETIAQQTGRAKRLLYNYLRQYWREGQVKNALIPRFDRRGLKPDQIMEADGVKRGRRRRGTELAGMNIDPATKKLLLKGYHRFYVSGESRSVTEAYERTLTTFFRVGDRVDADGIIQPILPPKSKLPTLRQFKYHCHQQQNRAEVLASRDGLSRTAANYGPKLGSARLMAFGPGMWYLIDSTPADCLLVSSLDRSQVLGKPTLYFVKDLFSMMIVGVEVSLEEASWLTEVLALQNAVMDKVAFCQTYGLTISPEEWPCHYAPEFLLGDRGESESEQASHLVNMLGIQVSNTPPYRPDLKGPVELDFHLANHYAIHTLPGGGPAPKHRGDQDRRGLPCLTLAEFRRCVISYILFYNKSHILKDYPVDEFMIADRVKPIPIDLWRWGLENRSGHLRALDPAVVYQNLLPRAEATITQEGIEFRGLRYFSQYAADHQWYLKAGKQTGQKRRKVRVAYDPRTSDYLFLCRPDQGLERCPLLEKDQGYAHLEWVEVRAQKALELTQQIDLDDNQFQALAELQARLDHIVTTAQQAAEATQDQVGRANGTGATNRRENKRRERTLERQRETQGELEQVAAHLAQQEASQVTDQMPETQQHLYIPQPDYSDLIQGAIETEVSNEEV